MILNPGILPLTPTPPPEHVTCLETFFVIATQNSDTTGIKWVAVSEATKHPTMYRTIL
jgi:hypothetical protein